MVGVRIMVRNLGLNLVSGWLVVMHTYLYYFRLSLSRCDTMLVRVETYSQSQIEIFGLGLQA